MEEAIRAEKQSRRSGRKRAREGCRWRKTRPSGDLPNGHRARQHFSRWWWKDREYCI